MISLSKYEAAIQTEIDSAFLYGEIAKMQEDVELQKFYRRMSDIEGWHRDHMSAEIKKKYPQFELPPPSLRAKILLWLGKNVGQNIILNSLMDTEKAIAKSEISKKTRQGISLQNNETRHVEILQSLKKMSGTNIGKVESRHNSIGGNALRAAVLGANDGLVSNMSLVMGVAGATSEGNSVLIAGTAGLLAGAISMSLGEWISVKSSQELYEKQMELEATEIELNPAEEQLELELLYRTKGLSEVEAKKVAAEIILDPDKAKSILVKEELNIDLDELDSSPWVAAGASFLLFIIGAIIPLFPYFFTDGSPAIVYSLIASSIGLFILGAGITLITGKSFLYSGIRQVLFGLAAGGVTFAIGKMIGVSLL